MENNFTIQHNGQQLQTIQLMDSVSSEEKPRKIQLTDKEILQKAVSIGKEHNPDFALDSDIEPVLWALCLYFFNDERFEEQGYGSLNKGIFITGNVGCGKTQLMKIFQNNKRQRFHILNCWTIADSYQEHGLDEIRKYYQWENDPYCRSEFGWDYDSSKNKKLGYCFDDLGVEPSPVKSYGNDVNVMENIIFNRHEKTLQFNLTHFTSNLTADQLEAKYGKRIRSRLRQMCNFLILPGTDRRK